MKTNIWYALSCIILLSACGLDNYESPQSILEGQLVYDGNAIGVKGSGTSVQLELWQPGYELENAINVNVKQDGTFQAKLFDGYYKLVSKSGNGPWVSNQDTVEVQVKGYTTCEYPVTPYYTIAEAQIELNGQSVTATFSINEVDGSLAIDRAMLLVNTTAFVDETAEAARLDVESPEPGSITMTMELEDDLAAQSTLNARIGVKVEGKEAIYSTVIPIK